MKSTVDTISRIKPKRKIYDALFFTLVILIAGVIAFFMFIEKPMKWYIIVSGSMVPEIKVMDLVVVEEKDAYESGDIITFYQDLFDEGEMNLVTHRLDRVRDDGYVTMSMAANQRDGWLVEKDDVVGSVKYIIPKIGIIVLFIMRNAILISLGMIALLIYAIFREIREDKKAQVVE